MSNVFDDFDLDIQKVNAVSSSGYEMAPMSADVGCFDNGGPGGGSTLTVLTCRTCRATTCDPNCTLLICG